MLLSDLRIAQLEALCSQHVAQTRQLRFDGRAHLGMTAAELRPQGLAIQFESNVQWAQLSGMQLQLGALHLLLSHPLHLHTEFVGEIGLLRIERVGGDGR